MSSKQSKKTNKKKAPVANKKKAPVKKAPAKKAPAKKAPAKKSAVSVRPEDADRLLTKVSEPKPQFVSAEKLMKTIAEQTAVVRVNDLKSAPLRKRMLAWFKLSK